MKNLINIISKESYLSLNKLNQNSYFELITDVREDLAEGFDTEIVSSGFVDQLAEVIEDKALDNFNSYTYYWSQLLDQLIHLIQIHEEIEEELTIDLENELREFWETSEFSDSFSELIQQKAPPVQASDSLMTLLENQILAFFHLHIAAKEYKIYDVLLYNAIPEIGDTEKTLFVGLNRKVASFDIAPDLFPLFSIKNIHASRTSMEVEINTDTYELPLTKNDNFLTLNESEINILSSLEKTQELKEQLSQILANVKSKNEALYSYLGLYTHSIVPTENKESFAHPSFLGFSNISLNFNSSTELAFELYSLNGLHHINSVMAEQDLISESEHRFHNPWSKNESTLLDVFRDFFGHFWGFKVLQYLDFSNQKSNDLFAQSYYKLAFSLQDLDDAFNAGLITPVANELIQLVGESLADSGANSIEMSSEETKALIKELQSHR